MKGLTAFLRSVNAALAELVTGTALLVAIARNLRAAALIAAPLAAVAIAQLQQ